MTPLFQVDCGDPFCSPHPWCPDHRALVCVCTVAFLCTQPDVRAAIRALPLPPPPVTWPALEILTALPCALPTALILWHESVWSRPMPGLVVELGVEGRPAAWRRFLGAN